MTSSSISIDSPPIYTTEFRWMLDDDIAVDQCATEFSDNPTGTVLIRAMGFLSTTINRLEKEIRLQREEFEELFDYATEDQQFRRTVRPILRAYRRRKSHPYPRTTTSPSLQSDRTSPEPVASASNAPSNNENSRTSSSESSRTVEIHSAGSNLETSQDSNDTPTSSYQTAITTQLPVIEDVPGTARNPI